MKNVLAFLAGAAIGAGVTAFLSLPKLLSISITPLPVKKSPR